ncbi:hypothetical protein PZ938_05385 [Luteipulveratus sp. YIM 133132]|uniref:hypothetical protein n=1 Tax=Luteipulveratus flavus TaxID=3031728 RepID=UPI0023AF3B51|nr:hypothetical protein [Luteipulveratus sp. YIM 133132]MDE9365033.1 hypothetical protein [Luteipulveratus sp. YIM 133132]
MTVPSRTTHRSTADAVGTALLALVQAVVTFGALMLSMFFAMASDSCFEDCRQVERTAAGATLLVWVAVATGLVVAIGGAVRADRRGATRCVWPLLGSLIAAGGFLVGLAIVSSTAP